MLKKLTLALTLTAATASAEVTMEDQNNVTGLVALTAIGDYCGFDLTAESNTRIADFSAYIESKYSGAVIRAAAAVSWRLITEELDAAASDEAWCAEMLSRGPEYWSEPN